MVKMEMTCKITRMYADMFVNINAYNYCGCRLFRYCWIVTDDGRNNRGVLMEFLTFYAVIWLSIIYNIVLYIFIAQRAYKMKVCL